MANAPNVSVSFSSVVEAIEQKEIERRAREARMRNALEILSAEKEDQHHGWSRYARFVRATAREGLGRET